MPPAAAALAKLIGSAQHVLIFTGAGISTPSGIPDFRGPGGVWTRRKPVYYQDFMSSEEARREYWDYKLEGWPAFREARPNAVHQAVVELEQAGRLELVATQNTDGLHTLAGTSDERLVELHGSNARISCQSCGREEDPAPRYREFEETGRAPRCDCGGFLKHTTVSFGQSLRPDDLERAFEAAARADLAVALGSTLSVYPAAALPLQVAQRGRPYAIVNRGETEHDGRPEVTLRLEGDVAEIFPAAVEEALS